MEIKVKFEPRDIWVGVFWDLTRSIESSYRRLDVYVCVVPMIPIRLRFEWGWKNRKPAPAQQISTSDGVTWHTFGGNTPPEQVAKPAPAQGQG